MNETIIAKDREIRKLNKDIEEYERTIHSLRNEVSIARYHTPEVSRKDAEVMAEICVGAECGDWEPVKDFNALLRDELMSYQERIHKMEDNLKSSGNDVRALRTANVTLREELNRVHGVCEALAEQCRSHALREHFKDDIIREIRRQLKQAKAQSKEVSHRSRGMTSHGPASPRCVSAQPRGRASTHSLSDGPSPRLVLSREDLLAELRTSTPNASRQRVTDTEPSPDVSVILVEQPTPEPIFISDESISRLEDQVLEQCDCVPGSRSSFVGPEETFLKCSHRADTTVRIQTPYKQLKEEGVGKRGVLPARGGEQSHSSSTLQDHSTTNIKLEDKQSPNEQESIGRSSEVDSPNSSCASARAQYYHNKLLATLQILHNKEETVRVQTESLAVAEARIASLTMRSVELKREMERKSRELKTLRETLQASKKEKADVSITAQIQEVDNQKNIVTTLQNNLSVIEELYRECFYETAKQEGLIELLRKSYLDVRLMDKEKSEQISRLRNVINTQKWSLEKCQDISVDVENLKVEISNFLNSSNNDSGVWEESLAGDLSVDLQDISGQLVMLRELLTGECTCGLGEENRSLRECNEAMKNEMDVLRRKINDLESNLESKESLDKQYLEQIRCKENELHLIRQQLSALESDAMQRGQDYDSVKVQLKQAQELVKEKTAEVSRYEARCGQLEDTVHRLQDQLQHTVDVTAECCSLRGSACAAQRELARERRRRDLEDAAHRSEVLSLEQALCRTQGRGAELCKASRRATRCVRAWTSHTHHLLRELELQIKQRDSHIRVLELKLEKRQNDTTLTRESEPTCTRCVSTRSSEWQSFARSNSFERMRTNQEPSCSKCPQNEGSFTSSRLRQRQEYMLETSASEMGSSPPPVPPQRPSRMKKFFCENRISSPSPSVQRAEQEEAGCRHRVGLVTVQNIPMELPGSIDEVLCRVESASEALADSRRRWTRQESLHRT